MYILIFISLLIVLSTVIFFILSLSQSVNTKKSKSKPFITVNYWSISVLQHRPVNFIICRTTQHKCDLLHDVACFCSITSDDIKKSNIR